MSKFIFMCVCLVILIVVVVSVIEYFLPLNANNEMNLLCRNALIQMEKDGTLSVSEKDDLVAALGSKGFTNVSVTFTGGYGQGQKITLSVTADYKYNKMTGYLVRQTETQPMKFVHTTTVRKVIN